MEKPKNTNNLFKIVYFVNKYVCPYHRLSVPQFRQSGIGTEGEYLWSCFKRIRNQFNLIQQSQCCRRIGKNIPNIIRYMIEVGFRVFGDFKRVH